MKILIIAVMLLLTIKSTQAQTTWKPNPKYTSQAKEPTKKDPQNKYQCYGTTKKGERCKRKVNQDHTMCYQHSNQQ